MGIAAGQRLNSETITKTSPYHPSVTNVVGLPNYPVTGGAGERENGSMGEKNHF
jgi:hypothetical protein